jgi:Ca2+-binding EF-hand superfamily protein
MTGAAAFLLCAVAAALTQEPPPAAAASAGARHLMFLADNRPIFIVLRVKLQDGPFEASWIDSVRMIHASLDRNGDGKLTTKEADQKNLAAVVRLATGPAVPPALGELDVQPKDGVVSIDELAEALRPILGPFHLDFARRALGRTDALFEQLDRDKDGALTKSELGAIAASLRPLDFDDDEMISPDEIEPVSGRALAPVEEETSQRLPRFIALPSVLELTPGESSLRQARMLLRKYDAAGTDAPKRPDGKLSPSEFAIDPDSFAAADANGDDALDTQELRKFLSQARADVVVDVTLPSDDSQPGLIQVGSAGALPKGVKVRQFGGGDVELGIGQVRLDIHLQSTDTRANVVRRMLEPRFKAADANKDGYLAGKELAAMSAPQSPLAGLSELIDRDGDGKLYLKELLTFVERQLEAARRRLVVTAADQGRAIFGVLDLDRDRRLSAREVMRTVDRVMSWDADGDGRVAPDEIPYHFQVTIARVGLIGLAGDGAAAPEPRALAAPRRTDSPAGPDWFQKMDRNHDGDVSHREFLGPRDVFDRLDRDKDGLIDPGEALAATVAKSPG